jgi:YebC/PmpR family DNA-binding regulatory protein
MAGHSKWKNIAHKKEKTDAQRAKIFTKLSREIIVAVREGGPDPAANARLKDCIAKARANNVPNENIKRVIDKAAGGTGGENYESVRYEGYGPGGTAIIVNALTGNRNRTAGDMRHYFDKFGGNLGALGCVSWLFDDDVPQYRVALEDEEDVKKMIRLLDALEECDDVQEVLHNWEDEE